MEIGDYVRTDSGIHQITKYKYEPEYENCHVIWLDDNDYGIRYTDNEISSSPNIIDLIEVGDYVNGHKVYGTDDEPKRVYVDSYVEYDNWVSLENANIKSIVTKEQFESMEYKIK